MEETLRAFEKLKKILDRLKVFSLKQRERDTLEQIRIVFNGLFANFEFATQKNLVYHIVIINMNNTTVQEKLCMELKDNPDLAFPLVKEFGHGFKQQKTAEIEIEINENQN